MSCRNGPGIHSIIHSLHSVRQFNYCDNFIIVLVFARRPGALHPGLYRFSCIHMSSVFNISSDVSESYRAMFREHAVYARLEKNLHFSFVFKQFTSQRILH